MTRNFFLTIFAVETTVEASQRCDSLRTEAETPVQHALAVIEQPEHARAVLDPLRLDILARLAKPDTAANLARSLDVPRQKIGYHIRELERRGLIQVVEERRKGNTVEKLVQATATHYVIGPQVLGRLGANPDEVRDRFSSTYLVAVAARTIEDVSTLRQKAAEAGKKLPTFTAHHDVRFSSPQALNGFARELSECMARLASKYHEPDAEGGRAFRFVSQGYPAPAGANDSDGDR